MVTPSADTSVSNGVYVPGGITNGDVKPAISTTPLADFLMQLEEYTPTVSKAATFGWLVDWKKMSGRLFINNCVNNFSTKVIYLFLYIISKVYSVDYPSN